MRICPNCHSACLNPHPELLWWTKCPICAFCELTPQKDPLQKVPHLAALDAVEAAAQDRNSKELIKKPW